VEETFFRPGLEYHLFYTTLDLGIPSFFGILQDGRRRPPATLVGGAAHPNPQKAALKTFLELVQGLKWMDYATPKVLDIVPDFANIRSFSDRMHLYAFHDLSSAFEFLWKDSEELVLSDIDSMEESSTADTLKKCIEAVEAGGLEVIGLDLTPPDVQACGLHVTRVFAPGSVLMEGDQLLPFLGGSRWCEVPVRLGKRSAPLALDQRNPYPHPYP
jgi:ribosomal protein S12 methylthiotransferase accessory factor